MGESRPHFESFHFLLICSLLPTHTAHSEHAGTYVPIVKQNSLGPAAYVFGVTFKLKPRKIVADFFCFFFLWLLAFAFKFLLRG